ncbi:MAG: hypothetical protein ACTHOD_17545 [Motilibacteraceae bacterium]|nr:hypothetical protein [Motilibacteraceae bacterium]
MSQADISAQVARLRTDDLIAQAQARVLAREARQQRAVRGGVRRTLGRRWAR